VVAARRFGGRVIVVRFVPVFFFAVPVRFASMPSAMAVSAMRIVSAAVPGSVFLSVPVTFFMPAVVAAMRIAVASSVFVVSSAMVFMSASMVIVTPAMRITMTSSVIIVPAAVPVSALIARDGIDTKGRP
jgi:hypothetical protein